MSQLQIEMTNKRNIESAISEIIIEIDKNHSLFKDPSLENGKMGLALFYFFCHHFYKEDKYLKKGENMIEESIENTLTYIYT